MPMSACLIMTIIESYTTCMYVCGVVCAAFFSRDSCYAQSAVT